MTTNLAELPIEHPLRNIPLRDINAEYRNNQRKDWQDIAKWKIATSTYNQLGLVWTSHNWRIQWNP
jgi:hypothetical protein